jgi:hypothetical protein
MKESSIAISILIISVVVSALFFSPSFPVTGKAINSFSEILRGPYSCTDSDAHLEEDGIYTKGKTVREKSNSKNVQILEDECSTPRTLRERECRITQASIRTKYVACTLGCKNGACVKP